MKRYKVYHSSRFDRELAKFPMVFQDRVDKIEDQLVDNPYLGSPLNVKWFREKRIDKYREFGKPSETSKFSKKDFEGMRLFKVLYRVYYLIYEERGAVFMVAFSSKKDQQKVINTVRLLFDYFKEELEKLMDRD